jgi:hypothetical protein
MMIRRTTFLALVAVMAYLLAACAPKGLSPEAFLAQQCLEAAAAESSTEASMSEVSLIQSRLEEHQARLVEMQRMKSRIVTGRMGDNELAQWEPELLPWEEPAPEPEPEPEPVDTLPAAPLITEPEADTTGVVTDTLGTSEFEAPSDTAATFESDTTGTATELPSSESETPDESFDEGDSGTESDTIENEGASAPTDTKVSDEPVEASSEAGSGEEQPESDEQTASEDATPPDGESSP